MKKDFLKNTDNIEEENTVLDLLETKDLKGIFILSEILSKAKFENE